MARRTTLTTRATLLAVVIGVLALTLAYPLRLYLQQRDEISGLAEQNAQLQQRVDELRRTAGRYDDPSWVEDEARRRLHLLRPGEQAYLMPSDAAASPSPSPGTGAVADGSAWYGQLWSELSESAAPSPAAPTPAPTEPDPAPITPAPAAS